MDICIDFDGTCVMHEYPLIGKDVKGAEDIIKTLVANGHRIILWTMRSGEELQDAVNWYEQKQIPLFGINENPTQKTWTESPKAYAQMYIDDAALGCPLAADYIKKEDGEIIPDGRPYVDWSEVSRILKITRVIEDAEVEK